MNAVLILICIAAIGRAQTQPDTTDISVGDTIAVSRGDTVGFLIERIDSLYNWIESDSAWGNPQPIPQSGGTLVYSLYIIGKDTAAIFENKLLEFSNEFAVETIGPNDLLKEPGLYELYGFGTWHVLTNPEGQRDNRGFPNYPFYINVLSEVDKRIPGRFHIFKLATGSR